MTTFSVAITLASSRKIDLPRSRGARISKRPLISISTPSSASPWMCGSSRRRPITSPPGGGTVALPRRASSGPASRNEARMRRHSSSSSSDLCTPTASIRISFSPSHSASAPMSIRSSTIVCTSRIRGTFEQLHRLGREHGGGEDRQGAVLVPGGADGPAERAAALDHEGLHSGGERSGAHEAGYRRRLMEPTRDTAWQTLTTYTKSESLLRHALAVEASTRSYARRFGEDEELWGVVALLHDFDYEIHPTLDKHPQDGAAILREEGYPEEVIEAVLSHAEHLELPRDTMLKKTLFACDELSGFVHACGLVRPAGLDGLEPKSVKKKLKQPSFAAGVHRDEVYAGAELIGLELDEHIANVVAALQPISKELGLRTAADAA